MKAAKQSAQLEFCFKASQNTAPKAVVLIQDGGAKKTERRECQRNAERRYRQNHRLVINARAREYKKKNRAKVSASMLARHNVLYNTDANYRLKFLLRSRFKDALKGKGITKTRRSLEMIGCSHDELKSHLERHFLPGMTWDNRSLWQIDHHTPVWAFDLRREDEQKRCFHFSNLRPLWKTDNLAKGKKMPSARQIPLF